MATIGTPTSGPRPARRPRRARTSGLVLFIAAAACLACAGPWIVDPGPVRPADCATESPVTASFYLIGDVGDPKLAPEGSDELVDPVLSNMRAEVDASVARLGRDQVAVIFLGDNVYYYGLVPEGDPDRRRGERILEAQIASAGDAWAVFTAGNHDWELRGARGWQHVTAQREFLATRGPRVMMLPPGGCAGPNVVDVGKYLRFVFVDPLGFRHLDQFPQAHVGCPYTKPLEAYYALSDALSQTDGRHVVLALHYPLVTSGPHGGHFSLRQHLFPLTDFWPWAWVPLPVVGSLYPLSRRLGVSEEDVTSDVYESWVRAIHRASTARSPVLYVAGHEHSLQVHREVIGSYYAVSGAGSMSKVDRVEPQPTALMELAAPGYMRLDSHADGSLGLNVRALLDKKSAETVFRHCIAQGPPQK